MKIALAQINPTIGDLTNNSRKILDFCSRAATLKADFIVFPELSLPGYPPKDLLLRKDFIDAQITTLNHVAKNAPIPTLVGAALWDKTGGPLFSCAVLCREHQWQIVAKKILLPNYNIFDEKRYFQEHRATECSYFTIADHKILVSICEDAWSEHPHPEAIPYDFDPIDNGIKKNSDIDLIINISASPYSVHKPSLRKQVFLNLAAKYQKPVLVACQVGGNDQLLFDGQSLIIDGKANLVGLGKLCEEDLLVYDHKNPARALAPNNLNLHHEIIELLTMGIKDYIDKCAMPGVIIGLSGGIDSAVCLALAYRALGKDRVKAVYLPSQFSSAQSLADAQKLCSNLSLNLEIISIEPNIASLRALLKPLLRRQKERADIVDQNLQARLRGVIIMALSNASDFLMIATSNKSELAVGYGTSYGDMCGAFSPIGDLYKTDVYEIASALNYQEEIIPDSIIKRPPTAELKANQLDSDVLPDYFVLDQILRNFIELEMSAFDIHVKTKLDRALIDSIINMVNLSEYKRRQGPFPFMVSEKVFGEGRRLPIAKRALFSCSKGICPR